MSSPHDQRLQDGGYGTEWDETFAFIAGRTEAGFAFGTTWQELEPTSSRAEPADEDDCKF